MVATPLKRVKDPEQKDDGDDTGSDPIVRKFLSMIDKYDKEFKPWQDRAKKTWNIYSEQRRDSGSTNRKMSLLWSNISTLQPSIYAKMPEPVVSRRFHDDDPVARSASEVMERCLIYSFDQGNFDCLIRQVRDDFLVTARGTAWVRYDASFKPLLDADGAPLDQNGNPIERDDSGASIDPNAEPGEEIESESVCYDYVHWRDFGHNVCRNWGEVTTVWRKVYKTKAEGIERFGEEEWKEAQVSLDHKRDDDSDQSADRGEAQKATIYEIWDKPSNKVYFLAKAGRKPLEVSKPYLNLTGFFPCPKPAFGTLQESSLKPVPDYVFYQDQVEEIDTLTARIGALIDQLKIAGLYPSGSGDSSAAIERLAEKRTENVLIPVPDWATFKEGGGTRGLIEWWPVEQVITVLKGCFETRQQLVNDVYQITGISDIMRGESSPSETKGAQVLKSQFGSLRIRDRQSALAYFIRDCARIAAEIIAEKFQPETLLSMSNLKLPTQAYLDEQTAAAQAQAQLQALQQQAAAQEQQRRQILEQHAMQAQQAAQAHAAAQHKAGQENSQVAAAAQQVAAMQGELQKKDQELQQVVSQAQAMAQENQQLKSELQAASAAPAQQPLQQQVPVEPSQPPEPSQEEQLKIAEIAQRMQYTKDKNDLEAKATAEREIMARREHEAKMAALIAVQKRALAPST